MHDDASMAFMFADRIVEVIAGTRLEGYLHVTVPEIAETARDVGITYVDMVFARRDPDGQDGRRYEDRADPGTDSARQELEAAQLDWYGEKFELRWLDDEAAARVRHEVFHDGAEIA